MDALRVVHVIDNLAPGGTEKQCVQLVRSLAKRGVENRVLYFRGGPLIAELERSGVAIQPVAVGSFQSARFPLKVIRLARAIRRWAPDVVQAYGFYSNLPGLLAASLARVPVRIAGRRELGAYLLPAQRRADRWARKLAHRVVVNSHAVRNQLIDEDAAASGVVVVIRNGLDLQAWATCDGVDPGGEPIVGMVAHFREQKDHRTLLRAAGEVVRVVPDVRFRLVGSGPLEAPTREFARQSGLSSHVDFMGDLGGEALRSAVKQFRVSVLTSKDNEGLPNAILESMAAGRPVVATAVGGTPEIIEDGVTGFLVPPQDPIALAERVIYLLKEPSLARAMGERARRKVEREFTIERMADQFLGLYRDLLDGNR